MKKCLAGLLVAGFALSGCGGGSDDLPRSAQPSAKSGKAEPRNEDAVRAVAKEQAARYSAGDFGGAWDMWTKEGKGAVPRKDYIKVGEACDLGGIPLEVSSVRLDSKNDAVVRIGLGDTTFAYDIRYEDGAWRWQPEADTISTYSLGADKAIDKMKSEGSC